METAVLTEVERVAELVQRMSDMGLLTDPVLVNHYLRSGPQPLRASAENVALRLAERYVRISAISTFLGEIPYSQQVMQNALVEALLSCAIHVVHDETGRIEPTEDSLTIAAARLEVFLERYGSGELYTVYVIILGHDLMQPFFHHKVVTEPEFVQGIRHHPYPPAYLDLLLVVGLAYGIFRLKWAQDERIVVLTRVGRERYQFLRAVLMASGYLQLRARYAHLYQFDAVRDWSEVCSAVLPDARFQRARYLDWLRTVDAPHSLAIGCATGSLTCGGAASGRVSSHGMVVAVDTTKELLDEARRQFGRDAPDVVARVQFVQATARMPYPDATFDLCFRSACLPIDESPVSLQEMIRLVRPGGVVSLREGLQTDFLKPFFRDWFQIILDWMGRDLSADADHGLPVAEDVLRSFRDAGLEDIQARQAHSTWVFDDPDLVVQHLVRGVHSVQAKLMELPWDDQRALIHELIDRGRDVCRRYSLTDRTVRLPVLLIKGRRPLP